MKHVCNRRQLMALAFVFSLAPMMRLLPKYCADSAKSGSWLTPLIALPFILLYIFFLTAFLKDRSSGEGMGEMILRGAGSVAGGAALVLIAANALFYCGFILRSGADRFITGIYTAASPRSFVFVMLALGLLAALGPKKAIVRAAKIFAPILAAVLVLALAFAFTTVDFANLFPVSREGIIPLIKGAAPVFNIYAGALTYVSFLEGLCPDERNRSGAYCLWMLPITLLLILHIAAIVGNYGAAQTAQLSYPFFTMLRDVTLFNSIERIEAFVVTLWVLPDFIVFSTVLTIAVKCLLLVFDFRPPEEARITDMTGGRWLIPLCAAVCAAVALTLSDNAEVMQYYSSFVVPLLNLAVSLVILPLCFIIGKLRRKI